MRHLAPLLVLVLLAFSCYREVSEVEKANARAAGDLIIRELETYKQRHGSYPRSLEAAAILNRETPLGTFGYELRDPGREEYFVLSVGSYATHGFTLFWNSDAKQWDWDE